jgi:hypothetical protein
VITASVSCTLLSLPEIASALTAEEKQQWRQSLELVGRWSSGLVENRNGGRKGNLYITAEIGPNYGKVTFSDSRHIKYSKFLCEYGFKLKNGIPVDVLPISKGNPNESPCPRIEDPFTIQRVSANTLGFNIAPEIWGKFPEIDSRPIMMKSGDNPPPYPAANQNIDIPFPDNLDSFGINLKTSMTEAINILKKKGFEVNDRDLKNARTDMLHRIDARNNKDGRAATINLYVRPPNAPSVFVEPGTILRVSTRFEYTDNAENPAHIDALLSAIKKKFPIVGTIVKIGERNNNRHVHLGWDIEGNRCNYWGKSRLPKCEKKTSTTYEMYADFDLGTSKVRQYLIDISHPF